MSLPLPARLRSRADAKCPERQSSTYAEGTLGTTSITFADQQLQNVAFCESSIRRAQPEPELNLCPAAAVSDTNNSVVR